MHALRAHNFVILRQKTLSDTQKVRDEMHCGIDTRAKHVYQQWLFKFYFKLEEFFLG